MLPSIIFPYPYQIQVSKLRQQLDEAHLAWAREWKARQADFKIENIRFAHDPHWNKRFANAPIICGSPTVIAMEMPMHIGLRLNAKYWRRPWRASRG